MLVTVSPSQIVQRLALRITGFSLSQVSFVHLRKPTICGLDKSPRERLSCLITVRGRTLFSLGNGLAIDVDKLDKF